MGRNYPCLKDPTYGFKSSQNSSQIKYFSRDRTWSKGAHIDFDMISNWGKKKTYYFFVTVQTLFQGLPYIRIPIQNLSQVIADHILRSNVLL